jgi:VanZ family protein
MFEIVSHKNYRRLFILAIIVTLIMTLGVISGANSFGLIHLISDKLAHAGIFFVLAFLCFHGFRNTYGIRALIALSLFGLLIEVIQYYLPWRSFSWIDWMADNLGIILYEVIHRMKQLYLNKTDSTSKI